MSKPNNEKSKLSDEERKVLEELSLSDAILPRSVNPNTPLKEAKLDSNTPLKKTRCKFDEGIRYEVALDILGDRRQPMMLAIQKEEAKEKPCKKMIAYCERRLTALDILQHELLVADKELIDQILDNDAEFKII